MNFFKNCENFFSGPSCEYIYDSFKKFCKRIEILKDELGEKKFLLDNYLSAVLEVLNVLDLQSTIRMSDKKCQEILGDCYILCKTNTDGEKSQYFDIVEKYIDENPVSIADRHTKAEFYAAKILLDNLKQFDDEFMIHLKNKVLSRVDYSRLDDCYEKIIKKVDEQQMEYLNDLIFEIFLICSAGMVFTQQIVFKCVEMLNYCNQETSKQVFQLMIGGKM